MQASESSGKWPWRQRGNKNNSKTNSLTCQTLRPLSWTEEATGQEGISTENVYVNLLYVNPAENRQEWEQVVNASRRAVRKLDKYCKHWRGKKELLRGDEDSPFLRYWRERERLGRPFQLRRMKRRQYIKFSKQTTSEKHSSTCEGHLVPRIRLLSR